MDIQLMPNFLAVKVEDSTVTKSGIILADTATREKPQQGTITHVGGSTDNIQQSATWNITTGITPYPIFKVGQVILFEKYGAIEIKVENEVLHIIDKRDVIGILVQ